MSRRESRSESRPRSNPHQETSVLSIEEAFDKAVSLPSSPVRKEPPESFEALDQLSRLVGKGTRYSANLKKTTFTKSGGGGLVGLQGKLELPNKDLSKQVKDEN